MRCAAITTLVTPVGLPVTVQEFVDHARINGITVDVQPELLNRQLAAATRRAELFLRRSILTQTLKALFVPDTGDSQLLLLPRGTVQSVTSVITTSGAVVIPPTDYTLEYNTLKLAAPAYGSVEVTYVSGYGPDADSVPDAVKDGILEYATTLYDDRAGAREGRYSSSLEGLPKGVRDLWRGEQIEV
jgi:uncharacterized phiE125 gp8 family phage protein